MVTLRLVGVVALLVGGLVSGVRAENSVRASASWWHELALRDLAQQPLPVPTQPLVVVFLDPECPIANGYMPVLNALASEFTPRGISFLGAYSDPMLKPEALRTHRREFKINFAIADDRGQRLVRFAGATYSSEVAVFAADGTRLYRGRIDDRVGEKGAMRPAATRHDLRDVLVRLAAGERGPFTGVRGFGCAIAVPVKHP